MKHRTKLVSILMTLAILFIAGSMTFATPPTWTVGVTGEVKILSKPEAGKGPFQLWYRFGPNETCPQCSVLTFHAKTSDGLVLNGPTDWSIPVSIDQHAEGILNLDISHNDTCLLQVHIDAPCRSGMILAYLISAGDSIEMHNGKIRAADQRTGHQKEADRLLEVLSDAQLEYEYDIKLLLEHSFEDEIKWIDSLVGPLTPGEEAGVYTARTTKRRIIELHRRTMPYQVLTKEYPDVLESLYKSTGHFPLQDSDSSSEKPSKGGGPTKL